MDSAARFAIPQSEGLKAVRCRKCGTRFQPKTAHDAVDSNSSDPFAVVNQGDIDELISAWQAPPFRGVNPESAAAPLRYDRPASDAENEAGIKIDVNFDPPASAAKEASWSMINASGSIRGRLAFWKQGTAPASKWAHLAWFAAGLPIGGIALFMSSLEPGSVSGIVSSITSAIFSAWCLFVAIFVMLWPAFVAHRRGHHNKSAILALNVLLGWTCLGWAIAMVWAHTEVRGRGDDHAAEMRRRKEA